MTGLLPTEEVLKEIDPGTSMLLPSSPCPATKSCLPNPRLTRTALQTQQQARRLTIPCATTNLRVQHSKYSSSRSQNPDLLAVAGCTHRI
eukprot:2252572-Rhodomonas_salina.1